jgi:hypothetical protein
MKTALAAALLLASPLLADDDPAEAALKRFFEGQRVVVLLDLPATSDGFDVYPEREYPLDLGKMSDRTRRAGVSLREGDRIPVTKIKVKDDLIEFHLAGGGFNSFKDGSGTVSPHVTSKSSFERDLERRVREETDSRRKRDLQHELDDLRREREYRDRQDRERADEINEERRRRDRDRALDMGSRLNIRFEKKDVPPAYKTPEGVMRALGKYVDFLALGPRPPERPEDLRSEPASPGGTAADSVRKGMTRADVEDAFGRPLREDKSREGALDVRVASYERGGERFEVTYVDDVVIRVAPLAPR